MYKKGRANLTSREYKLEAGQCQLIAGKILALGMHKERKRKSKPMQQERKGNANVLCISSSKPYALFYARAAAVPSSSSPPW
jgi:hypothetical protein